jgi:hypothetical protein
MKKSKFKPAPGARFQTNAAFGALWPSGSAVQWRGALVRPHATIPGAWYVDVDARPECNGGEGFLHIVNAAYMEAER